MYLETEMNQRTVIAVVDNNRSVMQATGHLLRASGFGFEGFASVEAFLARKSKEALACLVLDIGGVSGLAMLHRMKANGLLLPVIIVTSVDDESARRRVIAAGCVAYLCKPFSAEALLDAVAKATRPT
jgi:FixJ family two-component response regulator